MIKKDNSPAVPVQYRGNKLNVEHSIIASSIKEAVVLFNHGVKRMLEVNHWQEITNSDLSSFTITDDQGKELHREVREGDFFKIEIPGPGPLAGGGYDWVCVEILRKKTNRVSMRVRPVASPLNPIKSTAHFFDTAATSTFEVFRRGRIVTAAVYGRNEIPNTESENMIDKIRNTAVAIGAIAVASRVQWENLVEGILREKANNGS